MYAISDLDFQKNIVGIYHSVFANENPFDAPFQPYIKDRLLLYKFHYGLSKEQPWFYSIKNAISALGEEGFYLTVLERAGDEPWHWYVPLGEAHLYIDEIYPLQNAIYSVNGKWGAICSDEYHSLLGGPESMIRTVQESVQDWDDRLLLFLNTWKQYHQQNKKINIDWLPGMISHIYGGKIPNFILQDSTLSSLLKWD